MQVMEPPSQSQLRWFGLVVASFFGIVGVVLWRLDAGGSARAVWSVGVVLAGLYYTISSLRIPLYLSWMTLVSPIGWAVSHLALVIIFHALMTPMALAMRLFGRDRLGLRFDASAKTYWNRREARDDPARYFRQA
jgi:hypothetical protein